MIWKIPISIGLLLSSQVIKGQARLCSDALFIFRRSLKQRLCRLTSKPSQLLMIFIWEFVKLNSKNEESNKNVDILWIGLEPPLLVLENLNFILALIWLLIYLIHKSQLINLSSLLKQRRIQGANGADPPVKPERVYKEKSEAGCAYVRAMIAKAAVA